MATGPDFAGDVAEEKRPPEGGAPRPPAWPFVLVVVIAMAGTLGMAYALVRERPGGAGARLVASGYDPTTRRTWAQYSVPLIHGAGSARPTPGPFAADAARALVRQAEGRKREADITPMLTRTLEGVRQLAGRGERTGGVGFGKEHGPEFRARFRKALEDRGFRCDPEMKGPLNDGGFLFHW